MDILNNYKNLASVESGVIFRSEQSTQEKTPEVTVVENAPEIVEKREQKKTHTPSPKRVWNVPEITKLSLQERLGVFQSKSEILQEVAKLAEKARENLLKPKEEGNTSDKLQCLIVSTNQRMLETGIIPTEDSIKTSISEIKISNTSSRIIEQCEIVEKTLIEVAENKRKEQAILIGWFDQSLEKANAQTIQETKSDNLKPNPEYVEQEFSKLLIGNIIEYRTQLKPWTDGALTAQEASILKTYFDKVINKKGVSLKFNTVGGSLIPVIQFNENPKEPKEAQKNQGRLYGSKNIDSAPEKISSGRYFSSDFTKESPIVSTISIVASTKDSPVVLAHELEHAAIDGQRKTQQLVYGNKIENVLSRNSQTKDTLIRFYLKNPNLIENLSNEQDSLVTLETGKIINKIIKNIREKNVSEKEIETYIKDGKSQIIDDIIKQIEKSNAETKNISESTALKSDTGKLLLKKISDGTTGNYKLDKFLNKNKKLKKIIGRVGVFYPSFFNPLEEGISNFLSAQTELQLSDFHIEKFDNKNFEHIGSLILMRLLNKVSENIPNEIEEPQQNQEYIQKHELLINALRSFPGFRYGKVIPGELLKLLKESKDSNHFLHSFTKDIFLEKPENKNKKLKFIEQFKNDFPQMTGLSDEQITLLFYLKPNEENNFKLKKYEKGEINTDKGLGHAVSPSVFFKKVVESVVNRNYRTPGLGGMGKKLTWLRWIFNTNDPGFFQLGNLLNKRTFYQGFGMGLGKYHLESDDPLEALFLLLPFNFHRAPFLKGFRDKLSEKGKVFDPITLTEGSLNTYTNGLMNYWYPILMSQGNMKSHEAIAVLSHVGNIGYDFNGQPTVDPKGSLKKDVFRQNNDLGNFIEYNIKDAIEQTPGRKIHEKIKDTDSINIRDINGNITNTQTITQYLIGEMSPGNLNDILDILPMGGSGKNAKDNVTRREEFERIANMMMQADYERNCDPLTTIYTYDEGKVYTLLDLENTIQSAEMDLAGIDELTDKEFIKRTTKQSFTIKIGSHIIGEQWADGKKGEISLHDAKEFIKYARIARLERILRAGIWGKTGTSFDKNGKVETGALIQNSYPLKLDSIKNLSEERLALLFGNREDITVNLTGNRGVIIQARNIENLSPNCGSIEHSTKEYLDRIHEGKKLSFHFSAKLLETERWREHSKARMEFWGSLRFWDDIIRFGIIAGSIATMFTPGVMLITPNLLLFMLGWSATASPIIVRNNEGWVKNMLSAIENNNSMMAVSDRFFALLNEDKPLTYGELELIQSQFESIKFQYRSICNNFTKDAQWDTNLVNKGLAHIWGLMT